MRNYLLRVEGSDKEFISVLPLVNTLLAENDQSRVNIITDQDFVVPNEWMPSRCYVFNIPDDKKKTVFGVHHFAANLHDIFNVDYYIDFVNDFYSAFLGLNFRAKKKIGLAGGPKSYLYNVSMESFGGMFGDQKKLSVLKHIDGFENVETKFVQGQIKKEREILLIDCSKFQDPVSNERLKQLCDTFTDLKVFGYVPLDIHEEFKKEDFSDRVEFFTEHPGVIIESLDRFDAVISPSLLFCHLSLLKGRRSFWMTEEKEEIDTWQKMDSSVGILKYLESDLVKYGIDEERELRVLGEIEDYIINYDSLRLEPS